MVTAILTTCTWQLLLGRCKNLLLFSVIVMSLQAVLAAKEIELEQYKSLVEELKQQVTGLQMDTDKTSLVMLQQVKNIQCH